MQRRFSGFALLGLFLLLASPAAPAGDDVLRLKPKEGQTYRYEMVITQDLDMSLGPMGEQALQTVMTMVVSQSVREVRKDGVVAMDLAYESASMKVSTPDGALGEAMGDDQGSDLTEMFAGYVFQVDYSDRGEVLRVSGFSDFFDDLMGETADQAPQLKQLLSQGFSDDSIKMMMQQAMPVFPEGPPAVGFVWTHDAEMTHPILGGFKTRTTYGYKGTERRVGRKCMRMDFELAMDVPEELPLVKQISEMMKAQGVKMDMDMSMDDVGGAGSIWTDRKSGMLVESIMNQQIDMDISMTMTATTGESAQPTTMDMSISLDQEIHMTLLP